MKPEDSLRLPADLERQLDAIERSANLLPPHVLVESVFDLPPVPRRLVANTPKRHALVTELRRSVREAKRVRQLGLSLILLGVCLGVVGTVALYLDLVWFGAGVMSLSGAVIGFAAVSLYRANQRVQRADVQLGTLGEDSSDR